MPHPKDGKNQLDFQMQNFMLNLLKKKKIYLEVCLAVNREFFFIISKGKIFRADRKKILMWLITDQPVSATIALFR